MFVAMTAGRWDTVDSVEMVNSAVSKEERSDVQQTNIVRSQVERMEKTTPVSPRFEEKAVSGWDKGSSPISNGWDKGSPPMSGVPSSHWDKVISTNAQWDKGGTLVPQWDKGGTPVPQWDKFGLPGTQWDKIGSPGTQWDKVGAPQWDKAGPPTSQWDKLEAPSSQWDKAGPPTSQWDKVGGSPGNNWDAGWGEKSTSNSWRPAPPPPPVTPHFIDTSPASRTSSFYSQNNQPTPRSPPPPIQPIKSNRDQYQHHNNINHHSDLFHNTRNEVFSREAFTNQARRIDNDRRSSVSTHLTDRMERIEIEESSEFLKPVDSAPPMVMERRDVDRSVEAIKTKLFGASSAAFFTYNRVSWRLIVRKEVFAPGESLASPLALHLVFCQVVQDVLSGPCVRINREHRAKMKKLLDSYGVTLNNVHSAQQKTTIKKNVVDLAKDWPTYFSRIFAVSGGHQHPAVQLLAVSHSGVRLLRREATPVDETLQVLDTFSFEEIAETSVPKGSAVQIMLTSGGRVLLYTHRANQVHTMIDKYTIDSEKKGESYCTDESTNSLKCEDYCDSNYVVVQCDRKRKDHLPTILETNNCGFNTQGSLFQPRVEHGCLKDDRSDSNYLRSKDGDRWYEALRRSRRLGVALVLYHAVRDGKDPILLYIDMFQCRHSAVSRHPDWQRRQVCDVSSVSLFCNRWRRCLKSCSGILPIASYYPFWLYALILIDRSYVQ
uniref:Unconventional myosin-XV-like domain-containing protein n=1 Tax=Timema monikensis TaxID=170555 RepID=A0A7R9HKE5_9NEOP|nr:unnamed protein product [Timema monikensis]